MPVDAIGFFGLSAEGGLWGISITIFRAIVDLELFDATVLEGLALVVLLLHLVAAAGLFLVAMRDVSAIFMLPLFAALTEVFLRRAGTGAMSYPPTGRAIAYSTESQFGYMAVDLKAGELQTLDD